MRLLRRLLGTLFVLVGALLLFLGLNEDDTLLLILGTALGVLGLVLLVTGFVEIVDSSKTSPLASARSGGRTSASASPATSGKSSGKEVTATIRKFRNTHKMRGINQFETEIILDIDADGDAREGFARQYLTPVQISALTPGMTVQAKAVSGLPHEYSLVLDEWRGVPAAG